MADANEIVFDAARFHNPPAWPQPSERWVRENQGSRPAPGWVPDAGAPEAPADWTFWTLDGPDAAPFAKAAVRGLRRSTIVGFATAAVALAITIASYELAAAGGVYVVFWGLILTGLVTGAISGVRLLLARRRLLLELARSVSAVRAASLRAEHEAATAADAEAAGTFEQYAQRREALDWAAPAGALLPLWKAPVVAKAAPTRKQRFTKAGIILGVGAVLILGVVAIGAAYDGPVTVDFSEGDASGIDCDANAGYGCWAWSVTPAQDCEAAVAHLDLAETENGDPVADATESLTGLVAGEPFAFTHSAAADDPAYAVISEILCEPEA